MKKELEYPQNLLYDIFGEEIDLPDDYIATVEYVLSASVTERQRTILHMYYRDKKTYYEIGKYYNLTRERIRQVAGKAVQKLRCGESRKFLKYGVSGRIAYLKTRITESQVEFDISSNGNKDIEYLGLSVRSTTCLRRSGVRTVSDILKLTPNDLMHVRNLGRKSYAEIVTVLETEGYDVSKFKYFR